MSKPKAPEWCVYRFYSKDGTLLYVGATGRFAKRRDRHKSRKPWFCEVARIELAHYSNRNEALVAEGKAIGTEAPRYNRRNAGWQGIPGFEERAERVESGMLARPAALKLSSRRVRLIRSKLAELRK